MEVFVIKIFFKYIFPCCVLMVIIVAFVIPQTKMYNPPQSVNKEKNLETYVLSPKSCKDFFSCTPNEFFDFNFSYYDETFDLRENAYINNYGELVLRLTENQKKRWRELYTYDFKSLADEGIYVSEDYRSVIIQYTTKEELSSNFGYALLSGLFSGSLVNQLLDGTEISKIGLDLTVKYAKTGEIKYQVRFPDYPIVFRLEDYDLEV